MSYRPLAVTFFADISCLSTAQLQYNVVHSAGSCSARIRALARCNNTCCKHRWHPTFAAQTFFAQWQRITALAQVPTSVATGWHRQGGCTGKHRVQAIAVRQRHQRLRRVGPDDKSSIRNVGIEATEEMRRVYREALFTRRSARRTASMS